MLLKKSKKKSIDYAENIINTIREPLIVLDQNLRVVTVGRSFYEFFKVKPEDTVGQLIYDLGNKQWNIPKLRELLETILPQKTTFQDYEVEHNFATIGRRIMLLNARQIEQASGKERIILLAIEDITERKEIEAGLEKTRKELEVIKKIADEASEFAESVINTVREPLISLDQDLRVVTVSRSFYEFFKVKPEDTVGQLIYDLGNKQWDIPKLRELLETILPQKTTFQDYEVEHNFATIGRRIMLLNARQIEQARGKERIILLAIEDITERSAIEDGLARAKEELQNLNEHLQEEVEKKTQENFKQFQVLQHQNKLASMGEMIGAIAHQWRQPLNELSIRLQKIHYKYEKDEINESYIEEFISKNLTTIAFMSKTIDDFRNFFRIDKEKKLFDIKSAIQEAINLQSAQLKNHNINLILEGNSFSFLGYKTEFQHAIINIISNAKDALIKREIESAEIDIKIIENKILIHDNAKGIDESIIDRVFEPYFTTKAQGEGTGIGLYMSKMIIEDNMKGKISVKNENGGALFSIELNV